MREGQLIRLLPEYRLWERNTHAIYPARRFLDAKIKTWVEFHMAELPPLPAQVEALQDDPKHWAINSKWLFRKT